MRVAGLDVGTKTVGIAISDVLGWTAQGLETIPIDVEQKNLGFKRIAELIAQYDIEQFVVGHPINMNGTVGPRALACQDYAERLQSKFDIPVELIDERLSTMASERVLIEAGVRREKRKQVIDKMAATLILQIYLDAKKS